MNKFKVGDVVVVLPAHDDYHYNNNSTLQPGDIDRVKNTWENIDIIQLEKEGNSWNYKRFREATALEVAAFEAGYKTVAQYMSADDSQILPNEGYCEPKSDEDKQYLIQLLTIKGYRRTGSRDSHHKVIAWYADGKDYQFLRSPIESWTDKPYIINSQFSNNKTNKNVNLQTTTIERPQSIGGRGIRPPSGKGKIASTSRLVGNQIRGEKVRKGIRGSLLFFHVLPS